MRLSSPFFRFPDIPLSTATEIVALTGASVRVSPQVRRRSSDVRFFRSLRSGNKALRRYKSPLSLAVRSVAFCASTAGKLCSYAGTIMSTQGLSRHCVSTDLPCSYAAFEGDHSLNES